MTSDWETVGSLVSSFRAKPSNLCHLRSGGRCLELPNGKPVTHSLSGIALFILAALYNFYAPHHHFAFLISNFSFNRGFQT